MILWDLGVSSGGFRGSCCLLEGSGDIPEVSWGPQGVPRGAWSPPEVSNGDLEDNLTEQHVLACVTRDTG